GVTAAMDLSFVMAGLVPAIYGPDCAALHPSYRNSQRSPTPVPAGACRARSMRSTISGGRRALALRRVCSPLGQKAMSLMARTANAPSNKRTMPTSKLLPRRDVGAVGDQPITVSPRASIDAMTADLVARNDDALGATLDASRRSV